MRLACLLCVCVILALAARSKIRDRMALKTATVFTGAYLAGWGDALSSVSGVVDDCLAEGEIGVDEAHYAGQVRAAREGRQ